MEFPKIKFEFEVGIKEKHTVIFDFQFPLTIIAVDGIIIVRDSIRMNAGNTFPYHFKVGKEEMHDVNIILNRQWHGMSQPAEFLCEVFVDGNFLMKY